MKKEPRNRPIRLAGTYQVKHEGISSFAIAPAWHRRSDTSLSRSFCAAFATLCFAIVVLLRNGGGSRVGVR